MQAVFLTVSDLTGMSLGLRLLIPAGVCMVFGVLAWAFSRMVSRQCGVAIFVGWDRA